MIRLNKYLAQSGLGSRRSVEKYIKSGEVLVDGTPVKSPGFLLPSQSEVLFRGNPVQITTYSIYIALNKPAGYITTVNDEKGRRTVMKLVRSPVRIFPVGRLDKETEGLLLLTNDGELANRLIHPRFKIEKTYLVHLNRKAGREIVKKFRQGVVIDKKYRVTADLRFTHSPVGGKRCIVKISQGRNRQIRKMFAALGFRVAFLQRIEIGQLQLGKLKLGSWRYLTNKEIMLLKQTVGLRNGNNE